MLGYLWRARRWGMKLFLVNQGARRVAHLAATRHPTQDWTAQQLRNATMDGVAPRFLIRDRGDRRRLPGTIAQNRGRSP